jgi:uncharacterized membrane protein YgdD (TMEM256/DUF423 family)
MGPVWQVRAGAVLAALAVAAGAFGAHALRETLTPDRLDTWKVAASYQLIHAVALVALGASGRLTTGLGVWGAVLLVAGCLIFSGSLYAICLSGIGKLGAITPLGGLAFISGWVLIAVSWSDSGDS